MTYGSIANASTLARMPDLVAVVGTSGVEGFVYKEHLVDGSPDSPEEAERRGQRPRIERSAVPVYDVEGVTQIDLFVPFVDGWEDPK